HAWQIPRASVTAWSLHAGGHGPVRADVVGGDVLVRDPHRRRARVLATTELALGDGTDPDLLALLHATGEAGRVRVRHRQAVAVVVLAGGHHAGVCVADGLCLLGP